MDSSDACPACGGVGYFRNKAAYGEPGFGRAVTCATCDGYGAVDRHLLALREASGVPATLWQDCTFRSYDPRRNPQMAEALDAAWDWCVPLPEKPLLSLFGNVGLGKTHLAIAAVRQLIERGERARFVTVARLLDELRATQRPGSTTDLAAYRAEVETLPALALDDLGADRVTDFATEQLFLILDARWQNRRRTLVTSNAPPAAIEVRVRSRLFDARFGRVIACEGEDQRLVGGA